MRKRADLLLVERGLFPTRARAQAAIAAGLVTADGAPVTKASASLLVDARIEAEAPHPWVSRAGVKLAHALDVFGVDPLGRDCLDLGASTGGFTQVLLARGARHVTAVDVGTGQLDPRLRADGRVSSRERTDARALRPEQFDVKPSLLVADLSFISLLKAIGPALACLAPRADVVSLIKPQFEVGPEKVGKGGLVDEEEARGVPERIAAGLSREHALDVLGTADSPILGGDGNREYLLHARLRA